MKGRPISLGIAENLLVFGKGHIDEATYHTSKPKGKLLHPADARSDTEQVVLWSTLCRRSSAQFASIKKRHALATKRGKAEADEGRLHRILLIFPASK